MFSLFECVCVVLVWFCFYEQKKLVYSKTTDNLQSLSTFYTHFLPYLEASSCNHQSRTLEETDRPAGYVTTGPAVKQKTRRWEVENSSNTMFCFLVWLVVDCGDLWCAVLFFHPHSGCFVVCSLTRATCPAGRDVCPANLLLPATKWNPHEMGKIKFLYSKTIIQILFWWMKML
jgi:hypothetical protein